MFFYRFLISGNGELLYAVSEYELNIIIHHQRASENCHQGACTDASLNCSEVLFVLLCVIWGQRGIPLKIKPLLFKGHSHSFKNTHMLRILSDSITFEEIFYLQNEKYKSGYFIIKKIFSLYI